MTLLGRNNGPAFEQHLLQPNADTGTPRDDYLFERLYSLNILPSTIFGEPVSEIDTHRQVIPLKFTVNSIYDVTQERLNESFISAPTVYTLEDVYVL